MCRLAGARGVLLSVENVLKWSPKSEAAVSTVKVMAQPLKTGF